MQKHPWSFWKDFWESFEHIFRFQKTSGLFLRWHFIKKYKQKLNEKSRGNFHWSHSFLSKPRISVLNDFKKNNVKTHWSKFQYNFSSVENYFRRCMFFPSVSEIRIILFWNKKHNLPKNQIVLRKVWHFKHYISLYVMKNSC